MSQLAAARMNLSEALQDLDDHRESMWEGREATPIIIEWHLAQTLRFEISYWASIIEAETGIPPQVPQYARIAG